MKEKGTYFFITLLITSIYLGSCSVDQPIYGEVFSLDGKLVGPSDFFGDPTSIISDEGFFILADRQTPQNFHLLDDNFEPVRSFGTKGNGPSEISLSVQIIPIQPFMTNPFRVLTGLTMKEIDLTDSNNVFKLTNYPKDLVMTQDLVYVNDTTVWGQGGSDEFKFLVVNTNTAGIKQKLPFVTFQNVFPQDKLYYVFNGNGFYHPWWDRVVWSHIELNTIEFYKSDGDFEKEWIFGTPWTEKELKSRYPVLLRSVPIPKGLLVMHIKEAKDLANDSSVASLYYAAIAKIKTRILFFNEEGEIKWSLKLDRFLNDFTFDVKNKRIVGVFGESEDRNIVVYELPEELLLEMGF
jgi:hypothetical protein